MLCRGVFVNGLLDQHLSCYLAGLLFGVRSHALNHSLQARAMPT